MAMKIIVALDEVTFLADAYGGTFLWVKSHLTILPLSYLHKRRKRFRFLFCIGGDDVLNVVDVGLSDFALTF